MTHASVTKKGSPLQPIYHVMNNMCIEALQTHHSAPKIYHRANRLIRKRVKKPQLYHSYCSDEIVSEFVDQMFIDDKLLLLEPGTYRFISMALKMHSLHDARTVAFNIPDSKQHAIPVTPRLQKYYIDYWHRINCQNDRKSGGVVLGGVIDGQQILAYFQLNSWEQIPMKL